ncbi:Uncharacterized protein YigE, DUF2233 family [Tranquillimonas rosea]|uniref:Uncharacterized protein YigE, DUF2233 family n=1 Tax=Tranquillimonas rosea TaxID=641238 RepID=A0A1H9W7I3_9RHOB|nr:phosphodiester glycosidase family protein [Tranquillimonas rosea]SES29647.1 Uncharacterized protein YigE, DUF2233 family [Tranquillimonas rosea]
MLRLAVLLAWLAPAPLMAAECETIAFDGADFTACRVDMTSETLRLWLRDDEGEILGSFGAVDRRLRENGETLGVAMNGGMYHSDRAPVGLYIEDGEEEMRVVTSEGPGNFGLLPNGVLCLNDDRAAVIESRHYADTRPACTHATQSGPMLVIEGELHPRLLPGSTSHYVRNGVGVADDGRTVWLAISDEPVNFHHFARLFQERLATPNALFLDGNISRLYAPEMNRNDFGWALGPILGTVRPAD